MNTTRRIAKNTAVLTVAEVITAVISLFFTMYVARYLGADGFGVLSFALAFTAIFGVFTDIGLNQLATREIARDKTLSSKYLGNVATMKIIMAVITFGLIVLTINLMHYPAETKNVVYLSALYLVFNALCIMFYSFFQAHERMEFVTYARVFNAVLLLAGALYAIAQGLSVAAFALIYFLTSAVTLVYATVISAWKFTRPKIEIDLRFWKQTLKEAWPFGLSGVFSGIYFWIGSVMLSSMKGDEVVGWFNAAYRLVFSLSVVPGVYFTAAFPVMSKYYVTSKDSLKLMSEKSIKYMLILATPIAVGTTLLASKIIIPVFGSGYDNSIIALQLLIWAVAFVFLSSGFARLFESLNKQLMVTIVAGACAFINIALNLVLIPVYSYKGAAVATIATEFVALAILYFFSSKFGYGLSWKKFMDIVGRTVAASAIMGGAVYLLGDLTLWIVIPISALLYFSVLFIIRGIDSEDKLLLRQIVGRKSAQTFADQTESNIEYPRQE